MKKTTYIALIAIIITSCTSSYQTMTKFQPSQPIQIIQKKPITTMVIDDKVKVEGVAQEIVYFKIFSFGPNAFMELPDQKFGVGNSLKNAAVFNALYEKGYDVIVLPRFTTVINKSLFKTVTTVKVTGFGAIEVPVKGEN